MMLKPLLLPLCLAVGAAAQTMGSATANNTFDYIVVGSGPGGGPLACNLARAGHSVLLLEAGDDQGNNANVSNLFSFNAATNDEKARWDFWAKHSDDAERELKFEHMTWRQKNGSFYVGLDPPPGSTQLGIWYPRAGTLGGCAMHNAGVCFLPFDDDWNSIANMTKDPSWEAAKMREYFTRIEKNGYLPSGTAGHGFSGYLDTSVNNGSWSATESDTTEILRQLAMASGQDPSNVTALINRDINGPEANRDQALGLYGLPRHATKAGKRSGPNAYIKATLEDPKKYPLTVKTDSFVTRILFSGDKEPTANGVVVMQGKSMYGADPRHQAGVKGNTTEYFARREVVVAGGTFNTPQLLKLSGIGPAAELARFNISLVKDLPGVGENMADNYEASLMSLANKPLSGGGSTFVLMMRTSATTSRNKDRNIYAFCGLISFEGFWPGFPTNYGPSEYECALVHMMPKSQTGYVRLRSADPQDTPDINFRFFDKGGDADLQEMLEAIKVLRGAWDRVNATAGILPWAERHPCPGTNKSCSDAEQRENIKTQAYSHHATSTCAIGPDGDSMAVLDSKFRVRGVRNLRVVDASAFPRIPGSFPVLPIMMLAEKATDVMLADARVVRMSRSPAALPWLV